jgi:hypothetical protein
LESDVSSESSSSDKPVQNQDSEEYSEDEIGNRENYSEKQQQKPVVPIDWDKDNTNAGKVDSKTMSPEN